MCPKATSALRVGELDLESVLTSALHPWVTRRVKGSEQQITRPGVSSRASAAGTQRYTERWRQEFVSDFYRTSRAELSVSSVALGTYLGDSDDLTDVLYAEAVRSALTSGDRKSTRLNSSH